MIGPAPVPPLQPSGYPPALAGATAPGQPSLPAPEEYHVSNAPPEQDSRTLSECAGLLEAKQRSAETLRADAARSAAVLNDLGAVLEQLKVHRREGGGDTGPTEKETNLRMLYEKVSRSLQRTTEELRKIHDDIEALSQFCGGGAISAAYDSYNVQESDVERMKAHHVATAAAGHPSVEGLNLLQPQPQASPPPLGTVMLPPAYAMPYVHATAAARSPSPVVPSLPLAMLPREHAELAPQPPPQVQLSPPRRRGLAPGCSSSRSSSSTSSSSSSSRGNGSAAFRACSMPATPPMYAGTGGQWPSASVHGCSSSGTGATMLSRPLSFSLLPQGPPVVALAAAPTTTAAQPPSVDPRGGSVFRFPVGQSCSLVTRNNVASPPRAAACLQPALPATFSGDTPIDGEEGVSTPKYGQADQSRSPAIGIAPKPSELQRSVSALRPARSPIVSRQVRADSAEVQLADPAIRKSYSTASLRAGRAPAGPSSPAPLPGRSSPLVGHRGERLSASPLRSSPAVPSGVASGGSAAGVVATFGGPSVSPVPSPPTTAAGNSSPLPPKRSVVSVPRVGPPRLVGGPSRAATPGPPRGSGSTCAAGALGARPGQASPSSPSPVLLGRSVSSQVLRLERAQGAAAAAAAAAVPPRSRAAMAKQPSSERTNTHIHPSMPCAISIAGASGTQPRAQGSHAASPAAPWGGSVPQSGTATPPADTTPRTGFPP